jgi:hypothetical protein
MNAARSVFDEYPGVMTEQNYKELAEQRKVLEDEKRAASRRAYQQGLAVAQRDHERQDRIDAERAEVLAPWQAEHTRLSALVYDATVACNAAELKSVQNPLDVGFSTDAIGAERCLVRCQLLLDNHLEVKP